MKTGKSGPIREAEYGTSDLPGKGELPVVTMEDGSLGIYKASLVSLEETGSGQDAVGRLSIANEEGEIGRTGRLRYRQQTEPYPLCIPAACI